MFFIKNDNVITVKYQDRTAQSSVISSTAKDLKKKKVNLEGLKALKNNPRIMVMEVIV